MCPQDVDLDDMVSLISAAAAKEAEAMEKRQAAAETSKKKQATSAPAPAAKAARMPTVDLDTVMVQVTVRALRQS